MAGQDPAAGPIRQTALALLAALMLERGRISEAKRLAAESCRAPRNDPMRSALDKMKLCD